MGYWTRAGQPVRYVIRDPTTGILRGFAHRGDAEEMAEPDAILDLQKEKIDDPQDNPLWSRHHGR